jgi:hypothetical protein
MDSLVVVVNVGNISPALLGTEVEIWDQNGNNIEDSEERTTCTKRTFFSMPLIVGGMISAANSTARLSTGYNPVIT